jgi:hypothetical protein
MFDTTIVKSGGPIHQTTIEKRAPTDESISLLHEFQDKAKRDIVETYCFRDDNDFKGEVLVQKSSFLPDDYNIIITFSINNKKYYTETRIECLEIRDCSREIYFKDMFYTKIKEAISNILITKVKGLEDSQK